MEVSKLVKLKDLKTLVKKPIRIASKNEKNYQINCNTNKTKYPYKSTQ